jgi:hypothetical protein
MHKDTPKVFWTLVFTIAGLFIFAAFIGAVLPWAFHEERAVFERKVMFAALVALTCFVGLPGLALLLCRRGALPGTRRLQGSTGSAHTPADSQEEFRKLLDEHRKRNS